MQLHVSAHLMITCLPTESGMCIDWLPAAVTRLSCGRFAAPTGGIAGECSTMDDKSVAKPTPYVTSILPDMSVYYHIRLSGLQHMHVQHSDQ